MNIILLALMKSKSHQGPCSNEPVIVQSVNSVKVSMQVEAGHHSQIDFNLMLTWKLHHLINILEEYHQACNEARTVLQLQWLHRTTSLSVIIQLISTLNNHTQVLQLAIERIMNSWNETEKSFKVSPMSFKQDQSKNPSLRRVHQSSIPRRLEASCQQVRESRDWSQAVDIPEIVNILEKYREIYQETGLQNTPWVTWRKRLTTMKRRRRRENLRKKREQENSPESNQKRTAWQEVIRVAN